MIVFPDTGVEHDVVEVDIRRGNRCGAQVLAEHTALQKQCLSRDGLCLSDGCGRGRNGGAATSAAAAARTAATTAGAIRIDTFGNLDNPVVIYIVAIYLLVSSISRSAKIEAHVVGTVDLQDQIFIVLLAVQ